MIESRNSLPTQVLRHGSRLARSSGNLAPRSLGLALLCALPLAAVPLAAQAGSAQARAAASDASPAVLSAFSLRAGTVQDLQVPRELDRTFRVELTLAGRVYTLHLAPHKIRSCNFQLLVDDGVSLTAVVPPPENTFQGSVVGEADSQVAASLWEGQLRAQIHLGGTTWTVQPLNEFIRNAAGSAHVVYRQSDVVVGNVHCGVAGNGPGGGGGGGSPASALSACEIAIDCDLQYYQANGSSVTQTQNAVATVINAMDVVYRRDVTICYQLVTTIVRTTAVYTTGPETGCSVSGLLQEMTARWNANHTGINRDTAHLFSGQGVFSGTVGCANLGVICSTTSGYGVSRAISTNLNTNVALVSHEVGHNWNANHCDATPPCYIMCSSIGSCTSNQLQFGPTEQAAISAHRNSRTCLSACGGCNNAAGYAYFGTGCAGSATGSGPGCVQQNWTTNFANSGYFGTDFFAIEGNSGSAAREIIGLDFYCSATPAPVALPIYVWGRKSNGEPGPVIGTATMNVGSANAIYSVTFTPPIVLGANTGFYVGYQNDPALNAPIMNAGTAVPFYFGTTANGGWFQSNPPTDFWNFKVNCRAAKAMPLLFQSSLPVLNGTLSIELAQAPAGALSALIYASAPASVDLTPAGAPGCWLYFASQFYSQPATTNAAGRATYALPIPNLQALCGFPFFQQIAVVDPAANGLMITSTRRGEPIIGN